MVAIVAVLAVVALPQYHDYSVRSKVTECLNFAAPARLAVMEERNADVSSTFSFSATPYCADVQVADDGTIVLTTQNTGAAEAPVLQLVPIAGGGAGAPVRWECQYVAGRAAHVPPSCRNAGEPVDPGTAPDGGSGSGSGGGAFGSGGHPTGR